MAVQCFGIAASAIHANRYGQCKVWHQSKLNQIMKSSINKILVAFFLITFVSCKKDKAENKQEKTNMPVEWILTEQDKVLFEAFSNNLYLKYYDENNNVIEFSADSVYSIHTYLEKNLDKGEKLSVKYNCLSDYFPNFGFNCLLSARPNQEIDLSIIFGTGTYWNDKKNDYVLSNFLFNPYEEEDNVNYWGHLINQQFLDSVNLRDTTLYNVFLNSRSIINTDTMQTIKCWYNTFDGIVAFENLDGRLWIKK